MSLLEGIEYVHSIDYLSKGIDQNGPYYQVEYQIEDWADADGFVNALLGQGTYDGTNIQRAGPHRHPLSSNLMCHRAEVVGKGRPVTGSDGLPSYEGGAIIRAEYRSPMVQGGGGAVGPIVASDEPGLFHHIEPSEGPILWCTQEMDYSIETYTLTQHSYTWDSDNKKANVPFQYDIRIMTYNLTFHRVPYLPRQAIKDCIGKLNGSTFLGAAAETVIFDGARTIREVGVNGLISQKVMLTFRERPVSWNKFLREGSMPSNAASWDYLEDASGNRRYSTTNLTTNLLRKLAPV